MYRPNSKREYALDISFRSQSPIKLKRYFTNAKRKCVLDISFRSQSPIKLKWYFTNAKRKCVLDVSFRSQSRIKRECIVQILSVSARYISHSGLNRESSVSTFHEY